MTASGGSDISKEEPNISKIVTMSNKENIVFTDKHEQARRSYFWAETTRDMDVDIPTTDYVSGVEQEVDTQNGSEADELKYSLVYLNQAKLQQG